MTPEQWDDVIQVNLNSVFYMTKQVISPMMKAKSGAIINMSSVSLAKWVMPAKAVMLLQKQVSLVLQNQWPKNWAAAIFVAMPLRRVL